MPATSLLLAEEQSKLNFWSATVTESPLNANTSTYKVYINGTLRATRENGGAAISTRFFNPAVSIGSGGSYFQHVVIDNRVWSDGEMASIASAWTKNDPSYTDPNCE